MTDARMVVSLGTDHHPCDRVSGWLESWLRSNPGLACVFQHGSSRPVEGARCVDILPRPELLRLQGGADVVVTQGGPGSIMDARSVGRRPITIPRRTDLGEVVDDHQVAFSRRMAALGWIELAETEEVFVGSVDAALADPRTVRIPITPSPVPETVRRLSREIDALGAGRPGFVKLSRVGHLLTSGRRREVTPGTESR